VITDQAELNKLASSCVFNLDGEIEIETEPETRFMTEEVEMDYRGRGIVPPSYTGRTVDMRYRTFDWDYYDFSTYNDFQFDLKAAPYKKLVLNYYPEFAGDAEMLGMSITADNILAEVSRLGVTSAAESQVSVEEMLGSMI
jgi:hypothetical protein